MVDWFEAIVLEAVREGPSAAHLVKAVGLVANRSGSLVAVGHAVAAPRLDGASVNRVRNSHQITSRFVIAAVREHTGFNAPDGLRAVDLVIVAFRSAKEASISATFAEQKATISCRVALTQQPASGLWI